MIKSRGSFYFAVPAVALALASCSSGKSGSPPAVVTSIPPIGGSHSASPTPSAKPTVSSARVAEANIAAFMTALAQTNPPTVAAAEKLTVPGSPAFEYAAYHVADSTVVQDNAVPGVVPSTIKKIDATHWQLCDKNSAKPTAPPTCAPFDHFQVSPAGKLVSLNVFGESVASRLIQPGALGSAGGVNATLVSGYRSSDSGTAGLSNLILDVDLTNTNGAAVNINESTQVAYVGADGTTKTVTGGIGPTSLLPGAKAHYEFFFTNALPGGTLNIGGSTTPDFTPFLVPLKVG